MIVIKVEMWPGGNESRAEEFARAIISNDVKTTVATAGSRGDYTVTLLGGVWGRTDLIVKTWKKGKVRGFNRVTRGVWDLIFLALKDTIGSRNP